LVESIVVSCRFMRSGKRLRPPMRVGGSCTT